MYSKTYFWQEKDHAVKLPVKWLALEALTEGVFSEKSDVVSYVADKPVAFYPAFGFNSVINNSVINSSVCLSILM